MRKETGFDRFGLSRDHNDFYVGVSRIMQARGSIPRSKRAHDSGSPCLIPRRMIY